MTTLTISKTTLALAAIDNANRAGSTEWDVYVSIDGGSVDTRHNTHDNRKWLEAVDLYYAYGESDLDDNNGGYDVVDWMISDGLDFDAIEELLKSQWDNADDLEIDWTE